MAKPDQKKNKPTANKVLKVKNPPVIFPKAVKPKDTSKDPVQLPSLLFVGCGTLCVRKTKERYPNGLSNAWHTYAEKAIIERWGDWSADARQPIAVWASKLATLPMGQSLAYSLTETERALFGTQLTRGMPRSRQLFWTTAAEMLSMNNMSSLDPGYEHLTQMFTTFGTGDASLFTGIMTDVHSRIQDAAKAQLTYGEVNEKNEPQTYVCVVNFEAGEVLANLENVHINPPKPGFKAPMNEVRQWRQNVLKNGCSIEFYSTKECQLRGWKVAPFAHRDCYFWTNYKG